METEKQKFARRLREARERLGLTQEEAALRAEAELRRMTGKPGLRLSVSSYQKYERAENMPSHRRVLAIERALGIEPPAAEPMLDLDNSDNHGANNPLDEADGSISERPPLTPLALRLRHARERAGMSAAKLAERTGSTTRTVHRWETAETEPHATTLVLIARALAVDYDWLERGEAPERAPEQASLVQREPDFTRDVCITVSDGNTGQDWITLCLKLQFFIHAGLRAFFQAFDIRDEHIGEAD